MGTKKVAKGSGITLPPFVVYGDGSVYSGLHLTEKVQTGPVDRPTLLLIPLVAVNDRAETASAGDWDYAGVTCIALQPGDLDQLLDSEDHAWVPAHHWHEAWRIGEKLARWNRWLGKNPHSGDACTEKAAATLTGAAA